MCTISYRDKTSRARQIINAELGLEDGQGYDGNKQKGRKSAEVVVSVGEQISVKNSPGQEKVGAKRKTDSDLVISEQKKKSKPSDSDVEWLEEEIISVQSASLATPTTIEDFGDSFLETIEGIKQEEIKPKRGRGRGRGGRSRGRGSRARTPVVSTPLSINDGQNWDSGRSGTPQSSKECENCQVYIQELAILKEELREKKEIVGKWDSMIENFLRVYQKKLDQANNDIETLTTKLASKQLTDDFFLKKKHRVIMYTGLPSYKILMSLFELVQAAVKNEHQIYSITNFQKFILVLMRLKMNLKFKDLAHRFDVNLSKIERFFPVWMEAFHQQLAHVLVWPPNNVEFRLAVLGQNLKNQYKVIKDVVPVTKFLTTEGLVRPNHRIEIVCAALCHISEVAESEHQDQLADVLANKEEIVNGYLKCIGKYVPPPAEEAPEPDGEAKSEPMDVSKSEDVGSDAKAVGESVSEVDETTPSEQDEKNETEGKEDAPKEESDDPTKNRADADKKMTDGEKNEGEIVSEGEKETNEGEEKAGKEEEKEKTERLEENTRDNPDEDTQESVVKTKTCEGENDAPIDVNDVQDKDVAEDVICDEKKEDSKSEEKEDSKSEEKGDSKSEEKELSSDDAVKENQQVDDEEKTDLPKTDSSEKQRLEGTEENVDATSQKSVESRGDVAPDLGELTDVSDASAIVLAEETPPSKEGVKTQANEPDVTSPPDTDDTVSKSVEPSFVAPGTVNNEQLATDSTATNAPADDSASLQNNSYLPSGFAENSNVTSASDSELNVSSIIDSLAAASSAPDVTSDSVGPTASGQNNDIVFNTDVPSVAADLLSELIGAAAADDESNANSTNVAQELLSVANALAEQQGTAALVAMPTVSANPNPAAPMEVVENAPNFLEKLHLECQSLHEELDEHVEQLAHQLPYNTKLTTMEQFQELIDFGASESGLLRVSPSDVSRPLQCWIALSKLKLNLEHEDIAFSYGIPLCQVDKIIDDWINIFEKHAPEYESCTDAPNSALAKHFACLQQNGGSDTKLMKVCRFLDMKSMEKVVLKEKKHYMSTFSDVWNSVGPGLSANKLLEDLTSELQQMQQVSQKRAHIDDESLRTSSDRFVEHYTGFSDYDSFHDVCKFLLPGPELPVSKAGDLPPISQLLSLLLRLATNMSAEEILLHVSDRSPSEETMETLCNKHDPDMNAVIMAWMPWIHSRFMLFVTWPDSEQEQEAFLAMLRRRYRYIDAAPSHLRQQAEAVCTALYNTGHHLYCITSEEEEDWADNDELVDWLF